jgi:hypothetical protein
MRKLFYLTTAVVLLAGNYRLVWGQGSGLTFRPSATDPGIRLKDEPHLALAPSSPERGQLFLFLPGSYAEPMNYRTILNEGARLGLHTLGLCYENSQSVNFDLCGRSRSETCHYNARLENLTGEDHTDALAIGPADALLNRLRKALAYLVQHQPQVNWGQFLDSQTGEPLWERIVVAGHSQGGGMSLFIASRFRVARAVSFAGLDWIGLLNRPAPWASDSLWATPPTRLYGFTHIQDDVYANQPAFWESIHMIGPIVEVDTCRDVGYYGSHMLTTRLPPRAFGNDTANFHGSIVVGAYSPRDSTGNYAYAATWAYLLVGADPTSRPTEAGEATPPSAWPNPTSGYLTLNLPQPTHGLALLDPQGRRVWSTGPQVQGKLDLDLGGLNPGVYRLEVEGLSRRWTASVIFLKP